MADRQPVAQRPLRPGTPPQLRPHRRRAGPNYDPALEADDYRGVLSDVPLDIGRLDAGVAARTGGW